MTKAEKSAEEILLSVLEARIKNLEYHRAHTNLMIFYAIKSELIHLLNQIDNELSGHEGVQKLMHKAEAL